MFPDNDEHRAGRYVSQPAGYRAFIPTRLPPDPPLALDKELLSLLSRADISLGRLDGVVKVAIQRDLRVSFPTANRLVARFEELALLREVTGQRRSRRFRYEPYLQLFDEPTPTEAADAPTQSTGVGKAA